MHCMQPLFGRLQTVRPESLEKYKDQDVELIGLLGCGGCPGVAIVTRMAQFKLWNAPMEEKPTKVHIAPCIVDHCPHKETLIAKIKAKAGVEVIEGTHPFKPDNILRLTASAECFKFSGSGRIAFNHLSPGDHPVQGEAAPRDNFLQLRWGV